MGGFFRAHHSALQYISSTAPREGRFFPLGTKPKDS